IKADILSLSFGFDNDSDWNSEMQKAIKDADNADRIVFAAASNYGGNRKRTYPAKAPGVFCIHASDGDGNESGKDPTPVERADNFSTLGVLVPCRFDGDREVFKSGTSYATPIAAGIAANIMVLGDWLVETKKLTSDQRRKLGAYEGMRSVFDEMAETRQGYDYVAPWHLWDGKADEETVWGKIREKL
ncbi:subtilisin-like protein, partial [Colletotrichum falcatum]